MISYFMGERVDQLPREKLEQLFCDARAEIDRLNDRLTESSIEHVPDLAALAKRR